jgi:opacity protein-like surface antigen
MHKLLFLIVASGVFAWSNASAVGQPGQPGMRTVQIPVDADGDGQQDIDPDTGDPIFETVPATNVVDFYAAGAVGGANTCTDQTFVQIITIGGADGFDPATRSACSGSLVGGGALGVIFNTPIQSPLSNALIQVGAEAQVLFSSNSSSTFQGTPTTALGPAPGTDNYSVRDNYFVIFSGIVSIPVTQNLAIFAKAGYGLVNKTITYNSVGLSDLAHTPQTSQSSDKTLGGLALGAGVSWKLEYDTGRKEHYVTLQLDYEHIFLNQEKVEFGNPATVFTSFNVAQDVDLFTARVIVPLSTVVIGR